MRLKMILILALLISLAFTNTACNQRAGNSDNVSLDSNVSFQSNSIHNPNEENENSQIKGVNEIVKPQDPKKDEKKENVIVLNRRTPPPTEKKDSEQKKEVVQPAQTNKPVEIAQKAGWKLFWSDEFNGTNGVAPDPSKWKYETGGGGWGNNELQNYTDSTKNAFLENGELVIRAIKENVGGRNYTSARLITSGKFETQYGRVEARIKSPLKDSGCKGIWPAFWMLGGKNWPFDGEIDIMEAVGSAPRENRGSLHGPGYSGAGNIGKAVPLSGPAGDGFRVYAAEWDESKVKFFVNDSNYFTVAKNDLGGKAWVFDHNFFMLLNVAVGGAWPGSPDNSTLFPVEMRVDYVRVYKKI